MSAARHAIARAAEGLVGTAYRLHGRTPATGLDCLGLASATFAAAGRHLPLPTGYALRIRDLARLLPDLDRCGLLAVDGPVEPGDLLLTQVSPTQFHLLIAATEGRFVHAHAGIRQVVMQDGPLEWPIAHHWRLNTES